MSFRGATLLTRLFFLACVYPSVSCKKLLDVPPPLSQISPSSVFSSDAAVQKAMTGLYIQMMGSPRSLLNGGVTIYGGLSADELVNTYPDPVESPFRSNSLTADNIAVAGLYDSGYALIYTANSLLAGMEGSFGISAAVKQRLRGEALFSRALVYFYLVNLYGAVPLVTTTDFTISANLPRSEPAAVYRQIVDDLQTAELILPAAGSSITSDRTLPTRSAASALLARVDLYLGLWAQADSAASAVIGNSFYRLEPDLDSVFPVGSRETIWQLRPASADMATAEGAAFIPAAPFLPPPYTLTPTLLSSYESADQRRIHWTAVTSGGKVYPYKYKQASYDSTTPEEYNVVLRLAEVMLIRAEARVNEGNISGGAADLNAVRYRSGLGAVTVTGLNDLLTAIRHERQIELAAEWGHRWLDLKPTTALYPIPAAELAKNPRLTQNPGY